MYPLRSYLKSTANSREAYGGVCEAKHSWTSIRLCIDSRLMIRTAEGMFTAWNVTNVLLA